MMGQYLHIQCEQYALLTDIQHVERVVAGQWIDSDNEVKVEQQQYPCINLLQLFTGNTQAISYHCILMKDNNAEQNMALLVGRVNNIQVIDEDDFEELPNLDFPFNHYFDRVFIPQTNGHCIYRLKNFFDFGKP